MVFQTVLSGSGEKLGSPYGLAIFERTLIWTESQKGTVQALNLMSNSSKALVLSVENPPLFEIKVFDESSQLGNYLVAFHLFLDFLMLVSIN